MKHTLLSIIVPVMMCSAIADVPAGHPVAPSGQTATAPSIVAAKALIKRVLPAHESLFVCEAIPSENGRDVFEIEARDGIIVLRGNNGVSLAMAFNWYLKNDALASYDWQAVAPLAISSPLPMPEGKTRQVCEAKERFFLNYCTYGYTFPFTDVAGWQRFLDWMAMNGVNRPLIHGGQEAVWLNVWKSYGLTDEQILSYFTGPAHLPWHRMANIDKWGGPLPISYVNGQRDIQNKLLKEARALGMKPILAGFAGHVPEALKKARPDAAITPIATWGGFKGYNTWFLDPTDPLFNEIQKKFLEEQKKMYGTDHLYAADPFNEITPPSWAPDYIATVARSIAKGMEEADPDAVWYQMGWTFDFMKRWQQKDDTGKTPLDGMLSALPPGKMVFLEYMGEERELYRKTDNFNNAPFIWNFLANFGGGTYQLAPVKKIAARISRAMQAPNCIGVGSTLEGIAVSPVAFEYTMEAPWHEQSAPDLDAWYEDYAKRRAGRPDPAVIEAWKILFNDVYNQYSFPYTLRGSVLGKRPVFNSRDLAKLPETALADAPKRRPVHVIGHMVRAARTMLKASPETRRTDSYQYDVVNLVRQILAYEIDNTVPAMMAAFKQGNKKEFDRLSSRLLGMLRDLDTLVGTRHEFLIGSWIDKARSWGTTPEEKDYYERNARQIVTTWGGPGAGLTDYASREWNGLVRDYYLPRWEEYVNRLRHIIGTDAQFDSKDFHLWCVRHEGDWVERKGNGYAATPQGNPVREASSILDKYFPS